MFIDRNINNRAAILTIILAAIFWYVIFGLELFNFWYSMAAAAVILAVLAMIFGGNPFNAREINARTVLTGIISAALLYGIFWLGNYISVQLFSFAPSQVDSIYGIRTQERLWLVTAILFFVTSPAEEIFWRGFLQRWAEQHLNKIPAVVGAALVYGGVHIFSGNFMLIMAALVAGLFWGLIYAVEESVVPVIISHSLWTVLIFVFFPIT